MGHQVHDLLQHRRLQVGVRQGHLREQKGAQFQNKNLFVSGNSQKLHFLLQIFKGNGNAHSLRHSYLEHPVRARFVRVHVVDWHRHPSMRLEIVGCQGNIFPAKLENDDTCEFFAECNAVISVTPFTEITASSHKKWRKKNKSCMPDMGELNSMKGWCPRRQNGRKFFQ